MLEKLIPWFLRKWWNNWWNDGEKTLESWKPVIEDQKPQIEEKPSSEITAEPVEVASNQVVEKVDKLISSSNLDKVRYFLKELFRKELWVEIGVWNSIYNSDRLEINSWLKVKSWTSIEKIILEIISNEGVKLKDDYLILWNLKIKFEENYSKWITLSVNVWSINDKDLITLKEIIQKYLLPKCEWKSNELSWQQIVDLLWIDRTIYRNGSENKFRLVFPIENSIKLDNRVLAYISSRISSYENKYFIKLWDNRFYWNQIKLDVAEPWSSNAKYDISISSNWKELEIEVQSHYTNITKEFLEVFFKNFVIECLKLQEWWVNYQKQLEDLWVRVLMPNSENEKSLDEISREEWFVWYDDVKEEIDTKLISPWKQKEKYERVWKELFPQIKSIIPNYAIFEWEPGTWKTTEWKIIWRYLWFPFIYIPINSITSKWYWESEEKLNDIFETAWKLAKQHWWAVLMIDEIDEIGWDRNNSHEATWRVTWVLLKKLDWIERVENILLLASTNRLDKLDPALVSRSNLNVNFRKPNKKDMKLMLAHYIVWLWDISDEVLEKLDWKSGRDISNLAKYFASHMIKNFSEEELKQEWFIASQFVKFLGQ